MYPHPVPISRGFKLHEITKFLLYNSSKNEKKIKIKNAVEMSEINSTKEVLRLMSTFFAESHA